MSESAKNVTDLRRPRRRLRNTLTMLMGGLLLIVLAAVLNRIGLSAVGDIDQWKRWRDAHAQGLLVWRLCLYTSTAYGWYRLRQRQRQREPSRAARLRRLRIDLAVIALLLLLEASQWM